MYSEVPESRQHFELTDEYSYSYTEKELILELKECDFRPPNVYSGTRLKRHRIIRHLPYNVRHSAVPINSSLLTITLYSPVITTSVYTTPRL
jgi:hypothetical protein